MAIITTNGSWVSAPHAEGGGCPVAPVHVAASRHPSAVRCPAAGYSSLFAWAIALAPFKDNFYSTSVQPGAYKDVQA